MSLQDECDIAMRAENLEKTLFLRFNADNERWKLMHLLTLEAELDCFFSSCEVSKIS